MKFGKKRTFKIPIKDKENNDQTKHLSIKGYKVLGLDAKYPSIIVHRYYDANGNKQDYLNCWAVSEYNTGFTLIPSSARHYEDSTRQQVVKYILEYLDSLPNETLQNIKSRFNGKYPKIN